MRNKLGRFAQLGMVRLLSWMGIAALTLLAPVGDAWADRTVEEGEIVIISDDIKKETTQVERSGGDGESEDSDEGSDEDSDED